MLAGLRLLQPCKINRGIIGAIGRSLVIAGNASGDSSEMGSFSWVKLTKLPDALALDLSPYLKHLKRRVTTRFARSRHPLPRVPQSSVQLSMERARQGTAVVVTTTGKDDVRMQKKT